MKYKLPQYLFITGTGTGIGKTMVTGTLLSGLKAHYWKPIQCGLDEPTDTEWLQQHTNLSEEHFHPERYRLTLPLSPHASAAAENVHIRLSDFKLPKISAGQTLLIEGAGGLMVPLNQKDMMLDLIKTLGIPVLLVSANVLGTINHTLLSLEQLKRNAIEVVGVVLNGEPNRINRQAIEHFGGTRVLAEIPPVPNLDTHALKTLYQQYFMSSLIR